MMTIRRRSKVDADADDGVVVDDGIFIVVVVVVVVVDVDVDVDVAY